MTQNTVAQEFTTGSLVLFACSMVRTVAQSRPVAKLLFARANPKENGTGSQKMCVKKRRKKKRNMPCPGLPNSKIMRMRLVSDGPTAARS